MGVESQPGSGPQLHREGSMKKLTVDSGHLRCRQGFQSPQAHLQALAHYGLPGYKALVQVPLFSVTQAVCSPEPETVEH